jgi:hypothetical protein
MEIPKGLSTREKMLWATFRLETPITASSGKFAADAYAKWKEAKLADDTERAANREFDEAHANDYQSTAGVRMVVTDSSRGTGSFSPTQSQALTPTSQPKSKVNREFDEFISKAPSADFIKRVNSDSDFRLYVNGA